MKCKNYDCSAEANQGYPCCSARCGYEFTTALDWMKDFLAGKVGWQKLTNLVEEKREDGRIHLVEKSWLVDKAIYYSKV